MIFDIWNALKQQISSPKLFIILNYTTYICPISYCYLNLYQKKFVFCKRYLFMLRKIIMHSLSISIVLFTRTSEAIRYLSVCLLNNEYVVLRKLTDTCLTHFECYIRFWERGRDRTQHDGHCPRPHPRVCSRRCPYTRHGARRTLFRDLQSDWTILAYNYSQSF